MNSKQRVTHSRVQSAENDVTFSFVHRFETLSKALSQPWDLRASQELAMKRFSRLNSTYLGWLNKQSENQREQESSSWLKCWNRSRLWPSLKCLHRAYRLGMPEWKRAASGDNDKSIKNAARHVGMLQYGIQYKYKISRQQTPLLNSMPNA